MRIKVKVIANAKTSGVFKEADIFKVKVSQPAVEGKANKAVITLIAQYFNVKENKVRIVSGEFNSVKILELEF